MLIGFTTDDVVILLVKVFLDRLFYCKITFSLCALCREYSESMQISYWTSNFHLQILVLRLVN